MASRAESVQYITDQLAGVPGITTRKMFGEYAVYVDGKVIGLVCDDQFFVKPTEQGESLLGTPAYGAPYPGAKPHFLITDQLEQRELLCELIRITAHALPTAKPKAKKPAKGAAQPARKLAPKPKSAATAKKR